MSFKYNSHYTPLGLLYLEYYYTLRIIELYRICCMFPEFSKTIQRLTLISGSRLRNFKILAKMIFKDYTKSCTVKYYEFYFENNFYARMSELKR